LLQNSIIFDKRQKTGEKKLQKPVKTTNHPFKSAKTHTFYHSWPQPQEKLTFPEKVGQ